MTSGRPITIQMPVPDSAFASKTPWWLWPNLLALDAPAVGVVWQRFFGSAFDVAVPVSASVALAVIVWGVYLTDRWLDADPRRAPEPGDRHLFARRFRTPLGLTACFVWALACGVTLFWLPGRYVTAGACVAAVVAGYFAVVHLARKGRLITGGGKEAAVGMLFAAGVCVPLMADAGPEWTSWLGSVVAFAALCWLNCDLIARWETPNVTLPIWTGLIIAVAICGVVWTCPISIRTAVLASLSLLVITHTLRKRLGPQLARVLADAALLTPLARYLI